MSKLIDADAYARDMHELNERLYRWYLCAKDEDVRQRASGSITLLAEVRFMLDKQPTIDAALVVRCKDCIHSRPDEYGLECMAHYRPTKEDDFCSYGEKVIE